MYVYAKYKVINISKRCFVLKKLFCIFLVLMFTCIAVCAAETVSSGKCGDNLTYTLDSDGVLTISGTGAMYDYPVREALDGFINDAPWFTKEYSSVVLEEGVTSVGEGAFYPSYYVNLTHISLPSTLEKIGANAFYYAYIEELVLPLEWRLSAVLPCGSRRSPCISCRL